MSDADNSLPRDAAYWQRAYDDCLEVFEDERARAVVAESRVRELEAQLSAERARLEDIINFMKETARKHCEPAVRRSYEEVVAYFERTYPDDTPQPARPNGERVKCPKLEHTPDDCSAKCPPGWRYPNCTVPAHPDAPGDEGGGGDIPCDVCEETGAYPPGDGSGIVCELRDNLDAMEAERDELSTALAAERANNDNLATGYAEALSLVHMLSGGRRGGCYLEEESCRASDCGPSCERLKAETLNILERREVTVTRLPTGTVFWQANDSEPSQDGTLVLQGHRVLLMDLTLAEMDRGGER